MSLLSDGLRNLQRNKRAEEQAEREARAAEASKWFRPVALAIYTKRAVEFTITSNPWDADGRWTGTCTVEHAGVEKQWEIISPAVENTIRKACASQVGVGEVPNLVGYECCVEFFSHRTSITLLRGKTHGK